MSLAYAKVAAVLSVIYAGINVYQALARFADVREKARLFSEIAADLGAPARLRLVRALFYLAAPLLYLWTLIGAGLPGFFLITAGVKFWMSSILGLRTERRLLRGQEYGARDHTLARLDAVLNIGLAAGAIVLILRYWV